jgi:hypothetical protein
MIPVTRETITIAAIVICAAGILYLFREMNKTKEEFRTYSEHFSQKLGAHEAAMRLADVSEAKKDEPESEKEE